MRKVAWFIGGVTLLASGTYIFVYLYRWEWNRALFVAIVFVAAEVAMATAVILRQLRQPQPQARGLDSAPGAADPTVLARLRQAPAGRDHFAWLARDLTRTNVFITVLLGGGVVLSAGAWVLDRLAHRTAGPALDNALAKRLGSLALPQQGLLAEDAELIAAESPYLDDPELRLLLGTDVGGR